MSTGEELERMYRFFYLCPVGLIEVDGAGAVQHVNPARRGSSPAPTTTGSAPVGTAVPPTRGGPAALVTEDSAAETLPDGGGRR